MSRKPASAAHENPSIATQDLFEIEEAPEPRPLPEIEVERPALRPDGQFACAVCGGPAHFGFGVKLLAGELGRWACAAHREQVHRSCPSTKKTQ